MNAVAKPRFDNWIRAIFVYLGCQLGRFRRCMNLYDGLLFNMQLLGSRFRSVHRGTGLWIGFLNVSGSLFEFKWHNSQDPSDFILSKSSPSNASQRVNKELEYQSSTRNEIYSTTESHELHTPIVSKLSIKNAHRRNIPTPPTHLISALHKSRTAIGHEINQLLHNSRTDAMAIPQT